MDQAELGERVTDVRVTVERGGDTVGSPSSVGHRSLAEEDLLHVDLDTAAADGRVATGLAWERGCDRLSNVFAQSSDLADLLEEDERRVGRVTVDSDTYNALALAF